MRKYLKNYLDQIVFLDFDVTKTANNKDVSFLKDTPLPVSVESIQDEMISKEELEKIPFETFIHGMIYILGIDQYFKFNDQYKQFLLLTNDKIVEYILYNGAKLSEEDKSYEAMIYYRAALVIDKSNIIAMFGYAKTCKDIFNLREDKSEKEELINESLTYFEKIILKDESYAPAYYYLGFLYSNKKMFEKAKDAWEKYVNISEDFQTKDEIRVRLEHIDDMVKYEVGYNLVLDGKYDDGLDMLLPLTQKDDEWWNLYFFIGLAYRRLENYEMAIDYYKKVLLLKPSQADANNELGLCYTYIGDFEKAEKYLKKAVRLSENDPEILSNLAVVYMNMEMYEKAQDLLELALQIDPNDNIALAWMGKLQGLRGLN